MGPFKHTVDDGLDIRKAAFECMYTLLDSCLDRLDIFEFLNHVEDGLKDHYDIKVRYLCLLIKCFRRILFASDFHLCNLLLLFSENDWFTCHDFSVLGTLICKQSSSAV